MEFKQPFRVIGVANEIAYDTGLSSTQTEKKRLLYIAVLVNEYKDNELQGYHERAKVFGIPDRLLDFESDSLNTNVSKPGSRINIIEVGLDIPVGETFKVAIKSGAVKTDVHGFYAYELIGA